MTLTVAAVTALSAVPVITMSLKYETDRKGHDGRLSLIVHQTKLKPVYKRVQFRVQRQRSDS